MRAEITALASGTLFGAGLAVAQMTNPAKVIAFLDVTGHWDPSLAFVMGSALAISAGANAIARRRRKAPDSPSTKPGWSSVEDSSPSGTNRSGIDARLIGGSALFGIGWGLAGFCPGPALASIVTGSPRALLFVGSMIAGMGLYRLVVRAPLPRGPAAP